MILLVASKKDIASLNIKRQILKYHPFNETSGTFQQNQLYFAKIGWEEVTLVTLSEESVGAQYLPESFPDVKFIVFISRHSSTSGKPTLSVHTPGNFGDAELGGLSHTLSVAPAAAMRCALETLNRLKREMKLDYEVSYECTHHGPSLKVPTMFVELGSSELQWKDRKAARAVGDAAVYAIANFTVPTCQAVLGIGGPHYNQKFTRMALAGEAVFGHMIPKYALSTVDAAILKHCVERTLEQVSSAILDWKGIASPDKPKVLSALNDAGLPFKKV